jgi:hypothetical protein
MHPQTGAIAQFETLADAELAGYSVSLSKREARALKPMTREERKAWAATYHKKDKATRDKLKAERRRRKSGRGK